MKIYTSYKSIFDIDQKSAKEMADETKGYAFAYQVLGYVKWRNPRQIFKTDSAGI